MPSVAFVCLGAAVLLWPILLNGGVLPFFDSAAYLNQGEKAVDGARLLLSPPGEPGPGAAETGPGFTERNAADASSVRSIPYAVFVHLSAAVPGGPLITVWLQTALALVLVWAVAARALAASGRVFAGAALLALATPLPFFAAYLMPDLLGSAVILYAVLLVRGHEAVDLPAQVACALVTAFAVVAHYGHIPLAAATIGAALLVLIFRHRLAPRLLTLAALALGAAVSANAIVGLVAFDELSLTPRRMPLLLARSIEDGPARWHLEARCSEDSYAVCELWGTDIPDNHAEALWGPSGLSSASVEVQEAVRREEPLILWRALRDYPVAQTKSLLGNAVRQLGRVGTADIRSGEIVRNSEGRHAVRFDGDEPLRPILSMFGGLHLASYLAGAVALTVLVAFHPRAGDRTAVAVLVVGLLANALIFGGLSAPADRYGARIAWLVPFLALVLLLERRGRTPPDPATH